MLFELRNIKRVYGERTVLDISRLAIEAEKIHALIGPNGAGKSTLLNILAFLDQPSSGSLSFNDRPVSPGKKNLLALRRRVVLLEQYPILFTAPVWKNLEFGLIIRKIPAEVRREKIKETLELVGMGDFYHADAHTLSGGETKRVALARALVIEPEVLLCDEPTANVDAENQEIIMQILQEVNNHRQISVIFATHDLSQAGRLAQRTLILRNGRLADTDRENVFPAQLVAKDNGRSTWRLADTLQLDLNDEIFQGVESSCRLALDPNGLVLGREKNSHAAPNTLVARVEEIHSQGNGILLVVEAGLRIRVLMGEQDYRHLAPLAGESLSLHVADEAVRLTSRC